MKLDDLSRAVKPCADRCIACRKSLQRIMRLRIVCFIFSSSKNECSHVFFVQLDTVFHHNVYSLCHFSCNREGSHSKLLCEVRIATLATVFFHLNVCSLCHFSCNRAEFFSHKKCSERTIRAEGFSCRNIIFFFVRLATYGMVIDFHHTKDKRRPHTTSQKCRSTHLRIRSYVGT